MNKRIFCPNCNSNLTTLIYQVNDVPVNSVLLIKEKKAAINFPIGDINLKFCKNCSFIFNSTYNAQLSTYSQKYEGTQAFSPTYETFMIKLADKLTKDMSIYNSKILEIGCGQGEFLKIICDRGKNSGIGYDPSYRGERKKGNITFVREFFNINTSLDLDISLIICKMTLEHIQETKSFISMIRKHIGDQDTKVFFQVPNVEKIIYEGAFWDIYYEHCSYFCLYSLSYLFRSSGFKIIDLWKDYDDQYLCITAEPVHNIESFQKNNHDFNLHIEQFTDNIQTKISKWKDFFETHEKKRITLWGGGSKAVAFITTLKINEEIEFVVDINPNKDRTYLPISGHLVVNPEYLKKFPPEIIIVMNPSYKDEITNELHRMEIHPKIVTIEEF